MADSVRTVLQRQVARAGRRLFLQTLVDMLVWCWVGALAVSAGWFLVRLYVLGQAVGDWRSWAVAGGALGVGAVVAVILAFLRAPSRLAAALLIDDRFGLRERVTTGLTLPGELEQTPAGQALLADVGERVNNLDVASRFPVRLRWSAALVPALAVALLLGAFFLEPVRTEAKGDGAAAAGLDAKVDEEAKKAIEQARKRVLEAKADDRKDKSEKLQQIEAELDKLVNKPHETKQDLRERTQEINDIEADIKKREKDLADKNQALKEQLKNLDRFSHRNDPDGPASPLEKALAKGDFKKALDEAEKLAKKLEDQKLSDKEKEELQKQLKDLKEELQKIADQKEEEDKLEELNKKGELDEEQLERELEKVKQKKANLKGAQELADELEQCNQCMKQGDCEGAAKSLKKAMGRLKKMGGDEQELQDLASKLQALQEAKKCMGQGMCEGKNGNNLGKGKFPGTKRPENKEGDFKYQLKRERVDFDPKGQKEITDFVQGRSFKKKPSSEMSGAVKQATQEAPEALERQRLPREASDMTRGYYENLRHEVDDGDKK
jgi:septal ring factor EnvC (AmiA/AmiB activator)